MREKLALFALLLLWSACTLRAQKPILVIPTGHSTMSNTLSWSADGKYLLTAGGNLIKIWNAKGQELRTLRLENRKYRKIYLSPDGRQILGGFSYEGTENWILDATTGEEIFTLKGLKRPLLAAEYSPDSKIIATASEDGVIALWDAKNGQALRQWKGHSGAIQSIGFSSDGKYLATLSEDGFSKVWNTKNGTETLALVTPVGPLPSIRFSPDGKTLSIVPEYSMAGISLWSIETKQKTAILKGHDCIFSPDGRFVCTFWGGVGSVYSIDQLDGKPLRELRPPQPIFNGPLMVSLMTGHFLPDGKNILLNAGNYPVIFNFHTGELICTLKGYADPVKCVSFSPDGRRCLVGSKNDILEWDFAEGRPVKRMSGHWHEVQQARYVPDGQKIVSVANDYTGRIWDAQSGDSLYLIPSGMRMRPYQAFAGILAISPEGQYFVKGHSTGGSKEYPLLSLWNLKDGSLKGMMHDGEGTHVNPTDLAFSPDGKWLVSLESRGIHVLDVETNLWVWRFRAEGEQYFRAATFNHDGSQLVTGCASGLVQFWDTKTWNSRKEKKLDRPVSEIVFSPDGKWMATNGMGNNIQIWDARSREPVKLLKGHDNEIVGLDFSPDSRWLISASADNTVRIWDMQKGEEAAKIVHLNGEEWVVTTPSGLFDASPGAMQLMYFLSGEEVIELEQLKDRYYEPGLLPKLMGFAPGGLRPVNELNNLPLYPEILDASIQNDTLRVRLKPRNGGIGKVALLLDKREIITDANPARLAVFEIDLKPFTGFFLPNEPNKLNLRLYNQDAWLKSQPYLLEYTPDGIGEKGPGERKSLNKVEDAKLEEINFYALVVGTSKFRGAQLNLKYPDIDAASFADALRQAGNQLFKERTEVRLLSTEAEPWPRKAAIRQALTDIAAKADANDILLVYFSGHGITYPPNSEKGQFYYLTTDIASDKLDDPSILNSQAIAQDSLQEWIRQIKARKRILILDACNSGSVVEKLEPGAKELNSDQRRALERINDRSGMFVLAGSAGDKSSYEASSYGHGLLTYSLINGMIKVAAKNKGAVELGDLFAFVEDNVPVLAKNINRIQRPEVIKAESYPIGIIDKNVTIKMPTELPVFVRVSMMDVKKNKDLLGLTKTLNAELERVSTEKNPSLVFWDVESYAGKYYYLGGQYESIEGSVKGNASLYLNDNELAKFLVSGSVDALSKLAKDLIFEVQEYLAKNPGK